MIAGNAGPGSTVGGDKNYDNADFVAGGTSTGKTTVVNALLADVAKTADRDYAFRLASPAELGRPRLIVRFDGGQPVSIPPASCVRAARCGGCRAAT